MGDRARFSLEFRRKRLITAAIVVADIKEIKPQSISTTAVFFCPTFYGDNRLSLPQKTKIWTTVGLLICKSTDKTVVEWSLRDINKPLGVSTYQLEEVVERTVKELEQKKKNYANKLCKKVVFLQTNINQQNTSCFLRQNSKKVKL